MDYATTLVAAVLLGIGFVLQQYAARQEPECLFLFAGDALVGTPWYDLGGKGELDLQVMEALKPDACVVGNHDLDEGVVVTIFCDNGDRYLSERFWTEDTGDPSI